MIEQTLHGLVVGLGKIRKDGSKEFRWLDKPIHNRIVSGGLDYFLKFNGNNGYHYTGTYWGIQRNLFNPWRRYQVAESSYCTYSGCLQFMSIGTDGSPTAFQDTSLKSQVGGYSETPAYSVVPYNGVMVDERNTKVLHLRITLQSIAVENDTVVREVGWHGKIYTFETYPMFSRVVLPEPVPLAAGERLTVCYQMNATLGWDEREVDAPVFAGLLDPDGNQVRAFTKRLVNNGISDSNIGTYIDSDVSRKLIEYIINGYGNGSGPKNATPGAGYTVQPSDLKFVMSPPFVTFSNEADCSAKALFSSTNPNFSYPTNNNASGSFPSVSVGSLNGSFVVADHIDGTKSRDISVTIAPDWPSQSEGYQDIYGLIYFGCFIRFGHYDNTDLSNPVWVPKPWRKQFGQSYKFTFRYKLSTADTV